MMRSAAALVLCLLWSGSVFAQDFPMFVQRSALEHISKALCTPTEYCQPATESELQNPPFSEKTASEIVTAAIFSTMVNNCQLDYRVKVFLPFMSKLRQSGLYSEREIALAGMMHGNTMGLTSDRPEYQCTEQVKDRLDFAGVN